MKTESKAPASAVECAQGIYEVLKTGKVYRLPDGEPHTGTYQEIVAEIITAHTSAAVAEAREKALEEAAKWHEQEYESAVLHAEVNKSRTPEPYYKANARWHGEAMRAIRALKGKEGV